MPSGTASDRIGLSEAIKLQPVGPDLPWMLSVGGDGVSRWGMPPLVGEAAGGSVPGVLWRVRFPMRTLPSSPCADRLEGPVLPQGASRRAGR